MTVPTSIPHREITLVYIVVVGELSWSINLLLWVLLTWLYCITGRCFLIKKRKMGQIMRISAQEISSYILPLLSPSKYCIICESPAIWRKDIGSYKVSLTPYCWHNLVGDIFKFKTLKIHLDHCSNVSQHFCKFQLRRLN